MNNLFKNISAGLLALTLISAPISMFNLNAMFSERLLQDVDKTINSKLQNPTREAKIEGATLTMKKVAFESVASFCMVSIGMAFCLDRRTSFGLSLIIAGASGKILYDGILLCCTALCLKEYRDRLLVTNNCPREFSSPDGYSDLM